MNLRILHTNDMHGTLNDVKFEQLKKLRAGADVYFDSGDAIKTGNLGIPMRREEVWDRLANLKCDASVLGNRETHVLTSAFFAKLEGARHPLLCANLKRKDGSFPLKRSLTIERKGLRIGVIGVMVPMVTERMKTKAASAFIWTDPIECAQELVPELRPKVDVLIALTHIGHGEDVQLAKLCPDFDLVLGGHSHTVIESPEQVGKTWICQGGSHSRFAGVFEWASGELTGGLVLLA